MRIEDGCAGAGLSLDKGEEIREEVGPLIEIGTQEDEGEGVREFIPDIW